MIIYKITNLMDGKIYIGQTTQPLKKRWKDHCSLNRKRDGQSYLFNAIQKHGIVNFLVEQIDSAQTLVGLNALEEFYIKKFNCTSPLGYNLLPGGENRKCHDETKAKISATLKGRPIPNRWTGGNTKSPSEDTRKQIASKLKGRPIKNRMNGAPKGRPVSEDRRAKIRNTMTGTAQPHKYKKVRVVETGEVFVSIKAAAEKFGIPRSYLSLLLRSGKTYRRLGLTFSWVY